MTTDHLQPQRVRLASDLLAELQRWSDLPDDAMMKARAACWLYITHQYNTPELAEALEEIAEDGLHWEHYSAEIETDEPRKKHQAQNRKDWKSGALRIIKRHTEALKAALAAGII